MFVHVSMLLHTYLLLFMQCFFIEFNSQISFAIMLLFRWGDKENGVAGHGDTEGHQYTPKLLERLSGKKVVQLSACGFHTGCLTDMGEVYTWGEVSCLKA